MTKCPKCKADVAEPLKRWKYGNFNVKMYECGCGNKFREYFHEGKLNFVLSTHDGSLPTTGRQKPKSK